MSAFKAQAMSRNLREHLELTISGLTVKEASDSSFFPTLLVTKGVGASQESIFIKIDMLPDSAQHKDGLDLPQRNYAPHRLTILREDAAGAEAPQQPELRERVSAACSAQGAQVRIYEKEGVRLATDPATYDLTGATLIATMGTDDRKQNPLTNSQ